MNKNIMLDTFEFLEIFKGYIKYMAIKQAGNEEDPIVQESLHKLFEGYFFDDPKASDEERFQAIVDFEFQKLDKQ